jgi:hypothetical protein
MFSTEWPLALLAVHFLFAARVRVRGSSGSGSDGQYDNTNTQYEVLN